MPDDNERAERRERNLRARRAAGCPHESRPVIAADRPYTQGWANPRFRCRECAVKYDPRQA